jgi:interferon-induced GTP-binding protein Mx
MIEHKHSIALLVLLLASVLAACQMWSPAKLESSAQDDLVASHSAETRSLLIIDELRADGLGEDVEMPQIAVIGDQSSGKSSVLEGLSGIPFPRGAGLVTRCPIVLIMKRGPHRRREIYRTADGASSDSEISGDDAASSEARIRELAEHVCPGASFSTESITVDMQAPDASNLTVIDLPGIVRTTITGQSPHDIKKIGDLIGSYMQQERTIMLALVPANQDIVIVEATAALQQA